MTKRITKKRLAKEKAKHERFMMALEKAHALARFQMDLIDMTHSRRSFIGHGGEVVGVNQKKAQ